MMNNRFWKRKLNKRNSKKDHTKFHATIDKDTALTLYRREGGLYLIVKKELGDYDLTVSPSEAPIINQYLKTPDPFESILADVKIIEKEIEPVNIAIQTSFGENKEINLLSIKLAIGSGENDYVTIEETDLIAMDVEPTMSGLLNFLNANESVIGICDRVFDPERGNIILIDAKIKEPHPTISNIELKLMSSLQQRGLYMQKNMKYAGLQLYIIIKAESLNDPVLSFLKAMGIEWEVIFLRRDLSIEDWLEIECEKNSVNLKGYLGSKFNSLGFFDINNITRVAIVNQLTFKVVVRMAELLDRVKQHREELIGNQPDSEPLKKEEIIAAAKITCAYFGIKKQIKIEKGIDPVEVQNFENEMINI
ncbi:hypothetical protein DSAG12_00151 [Promethearchaeum syntrophicum]|uniref:Uncharacterized protein n=1 Tax=Promethearchaeum syntrophicum TaxID=2594042 RepID=A0A5B9D5F1_9ARCH|nr:hypothetical protein [Candidatus Prometheoarchaeum syntrophicum]QEE14338.1 hypothetical protein DSAG12_00151 [Candidatus Prometheoarchaeum syntrophicum]